MLRPSVIIFSAISVNACLVPRRVILTKDSPGFLTHIQSAEYDYVLDVVEISFEAITCGSNAHFPTDEINTRFRENGIGYQLEEGKIVRVDSQFIHAERAKPVIKLLADEKRFSNANKEFLEAHKHYRHTRFPECIVSGQSF